MQEPTTNNNAARDAGQIEYLVDGKIVLGRSFEEAKANSQRGDPPPVDRLQGLLHAVKIRLAEVARERDRAIEMGNEIRLERNDLERESARNDQIVQNLVAALLRVKESADILANNPRTASLWKAHMRNFSMVAGNAIAENEKL